MVGAQCDSNVASSHAKIHPFFQLLLKTKEVFLSHKCTCLGTQKSKSEVNKICDLKYILFIFIG